MLLVSVVILFILSFGRNYLYHSQKEFFPLIGNVSARFSNPEHIVIILIKSMIIYPDLGVVTTVSITMCFDIPLYSNL